jgi:hypothetical protein
MDERTQDIYNEWFLKYGYRVVTFKEVCDGCMIKWVDKLRACNALTVIFNEEQNTHNCTLAKLTKEQ